MFGESFLPKEAKIFRPRSISHGTVKSLEAMKDKVTKPFFHSSKQIDDIAKGKLREDGNGLFGDMLFGTVGFVPKVGKPAKEKAINATVVAKEKMKSLDNKAANKVKETLKVKEGTMLDRFTSVPERQEVGFNILNDGTKATLEQTARRSSLLAPVQNTTKVVSPFLAAAYVGDKMYPAEEQTASESNDYQDKDGNDLELMTERLDKKAALEKVSFLEEELEKMASYVENLKEEKNLFWKQAERERAEKERIEMEKVAFEKEMMEKTSSFEEFKLRTNIRERTKSAVKLAEDLLESGIIKQAEFNDKVDFLLDCDDETFNLHSSFSKQAQSEEKGLETSAYFIDYRSKDEESSSQRPIRGLSIKGQTIGEAAQDLKK